MNSPVTNSTKSNYSINQNNNQKNLSISREQPISNLSLATQKVIQANREATLKLNQTIQGIYQTNGISQTQKSEYQYSEFYKHQFPITAKELPNSVIKLNNNISSPLINPNTLLPNNNNNKNKQHLNRPLQTAGILIMNNSFSSGKPLLQNSIIKANDKTPILEKATNTFEICNTIHSESLKTPICQTPVHAIIIPSMECKEIERDQASNDAEIQSTELTMPHAVVQDKTTERYIPLKNRKFANAPKKVSKIELAESTKSQAIFQDKIIEQNIPIPLKKRKFSETSKKDSKHDKTRSKKTAKKDQTLGKYQKKFDSIKSEGFPPLEVFKKFISSKLVNPSLTAYTPKTTIKFGLLVTTS